MKGFNQINEILMDPTAVKVLSTVNDDGTVHSIYAGRAFRISYKFHIEVSIRELIIAGLIR